MSRLRESGEPPINLLTGLLPDSVVVVERFTDAPNVELYAEELALIDPPGNKAPERVCHCARLALFNPLPAPSRTHMPQIGRWVKTE